MRRRRKERSRKMEKKPAFERPKRSARLKVKEKKKN